MTFIEDFKHYFMNEFGANISFELRLMLLILHLLKLNDNNISFQDKNSVQSQLISFKFLFRIIIKTAFGIMISLRRINMLIIVMF